jgi:hypothetical protein
MFNQKILIAGIILSLTSNGLAQAGASCPLPVKKPAVVDVCAGLPMNSIINGSFEELNSSVGNVNGVVQNQLASLQTWDQFDSVIGWTDVDQNGIELWGGGFLGFQPTDGKILMEIKGNQPNTIAQDFCTDSNAPHYLDLDVAARTGLFGDNVVNVAMDGTQILHIDPAHYFFKTYSAKLSLVKGKHTIQLSSVAGTNPSMGGLVDNIRFDSDCSSHDRNNVGVETILMSLSEIDANAAKAIINDALNFVRPVKKPRVLFVRSSFDEGEALTDYTLIPQVISQAGYTLDSIDEPVTGLTAAQADGYDVIWFNNPGYPAQSQTTLDTLYNLAHNQSAGIVLSGDDMSSNQYVNMSELTLFDYGNNGTSACGQAIDNDATVAKYVVKYKGYTFDYGDDIDQDTVNGKVVKHVIQHRIHGHQITRSGVQVFANAKTNIPQCTLDVPAIIGYKVQ